MKIVNHSTLTRFDGSIYDTKVQKIKHKQEDTKLMHFKTLI